MHARRILAALSAALVVPLGAGLALATIVVTGDVTPTYNNSDPWSTPSFLRVGNSLPGHLTINGGSDVIAGGDSRIATNSSASPSSITIDGSGSSLSVNGAMIIGLSGAGELIVTNGGSYTSWGTTIGNNVNGIGVVTVGGGASPSTLTHAGGTNSLTVAPVGQGTLNILNGGSVSADNASVGNGALFTGTVAVGDGMGPAAFSIANGLALGSNGQLNINGGGLVSAGALDIGGMVKFDGGTLLITATDAASNGVTFMSGGGTINIPTTGTVFTHTNVSSGVGGLTKTGAGTLELTNANSYEGNTTVGGGILKLSGNGSLAQSSIIEVGSGAMLDVAGVTGGANFDGTRFSLASGQTLKGTGTVAGALGVGAGATLAPGGSIGFLTTNDVSLSASATLSLEFSLSPTLNADALIVNGTLALGGATLDISVNNPAPTVGSTTLIVAFNDLGLSDPISGTFGTINLPPNYMATINYGFSGVDALGRQGDGNELAITLIVLAVPEARAFLLVGAIAVASIGSHICRRRVGRWRRSAR
jgi:autotransporter-associated beta strand protein/T5SS/PEP-CTERM-associated repeat protein